MLFKEADADTKDQVFLKLAKADSTFLCKLNGLCLQLYLCRHAWNRLTLSCYCWITPWSWQVLHLIHKPFVHSGKSPFKLLLIRGGGTSGIPERFLGLAKPILSGTSVNLAGSKWSTWVRKIWARKLMRTDCQGISDTFQFFLEQKLHKNLLFHCILAASAFPLKTG